MADFSRLSLLVCLSFSFRVLGGIVSRDLHIVNANLSPDGFTRSYVTFWFWKDLPNKAILLGLSLLKAPFQDH